MQTALVSFGVSLASVAFLGLIYAELSLLIKN